jgi:hypothetical protein
VKPEPSWYVLLILRIGLWVTLVWCTAMILEDHSNRIRIAGYEAADKMLGPSPETLEYWHNQRLADAINPMSGLPFAVLFSAGFLAILHSLDLIRYRLDAATPIVLAVKDATTPAAVKPPVPLTKTSTSMRTPDADAIELAAVARDVNGRRTTTKRREGA